MSLRSILVLSAGLCALVPALPAAAQDASSDAKNLAAYYALAKACSGVTPLDQEVLRLARDEQLALVEVTKGATVKAGVASSAEFEAGRARNRACHLPDTQVVLSNAMREAEQWRYRFMLRAEALAGMTEPYAYGITTVNLSKTELAGGAEGLRQATAAQGQAAAFGQLRAHAQAEAVGAVGILCDERKTVRTRKGPRACPAVAATEAAKAPYARALIASAETFAPLFAEEYKREATWRAAQAAHAAAEKAAIDLSGYWKADTGAAQPADARAQCAAQDLLADFGKAALRQDYDTITMIYAPVGKPGAAPVWKVFAQSRTFGAEGTVVKAHEIRTDGFQPADVRKAFETPAPSEDMSWAGLGPIETDYLDEFHTRAQAASINGEKQTAWRRCG